MIVMDVRGGRVWGMRRRVEEILMRCSIWYTIIKSWCMKHDTVTSPVRLLSQ